MPKVKRIPFSILENNLLIELVKQMGEDWSAISKKLPGRSPKQVKDRYVNYLRDGLKKDPWTKQEEEVIISMYKAVGPKWSKMMSFLPGRSGNDIKNRWYKHIKKNMSKNQNNNTYAQMSQELFNIDFSNNTKFEQNSKNTINMSSLNENVTKKMANNESSNLISVFKKSNNLIEPILEKADGERITLHQQIQLNKLQVNDPIVVDKCSSNIENNQKFFKLINEFEIDEFLEDENDFFGSYQNPDYTKPISDTDLIIQDILSDINSKNFGYFWE